MKILAIEKEAERISKGNTGDMLEQEARQVYHLYLAGMLREIYFNEKHCAVLVMECESSEKAEEMLGTLPLVKSRLITFDIMELNPYDGYERILNKEF